jgi:demethylmenaquinone methyltransferase/2-methoxy-6-polyprenyl-1,4-benzoquinol methylase
LSHLHGVERTRYVRRLFAQIAPRYDLLNRLMTGGQDLRWRQEAISHLEIPAAGLILDAGAGTGDISLAIHKRRPHVRVVAFDLTPEMIALARHRQGSHAIHWLIADAHNLPFANGRFDGIISGYLLRNVGDLQQTLTEQLRALRCGGRMVALDTTPPGRSLFRPLIRIYLKWIIPILGRIFAGSSEAYTYLPDSTTQFLSAEALAERMQRAGFSGVGFVRRMFGTMAIHYSSKGDISGQSGD